MCKIFSRRINRYTVAKPIALWSSIVSQMVHEVSSSSGVWKQAEKEIDYHCLLFPSSSFKHGQLVALPLTQQNSMHIHLTLVLALSEDIPVCGAMMEKLHQTVYGAGL